MGNLAVKCESRWQTRKIDVRCVGGTVDVRIMRADGTGTEEFNRPVVALEVMYQFPDYVVVMWCPNHNPRLGKRGQLRVLQRHDILTPGKIYFLFPIPPEVAKKNIGEINISKRSHRMQSSKDHLVQLLQRSGQMSESLSTGTSSANESAEEEKLSFRAFYSWKPEAASEDSTASTKEDTSGREPKAHFQPGFNNWRPALMSIPESPVGFQSRPGSPLTPIAFRLVSFRETETWPEKQGDSKDGKI